MLMEAVYWQGEQGVPDMHMTHVHAGCILPLASHPPVRTYALGLSAFCRGCHRAVRVQE